MVQLPPRRHMAQRPHQAHSGPNYRTFHQRIHLSHLHQYRESAAPVYGALGDTAEAFAFDSGGMAYLAAGDGGELFVGAGTVEGLGFGVCGIWMEYFLERFCDEDVILE